MNETVARIVEIMFQDVVVNEEVRALKDEVMNNCQERYQDLVARGLSEDEATAAVVESLRGMEEVIAQYPRKNGTATAEPVDVSGDKELLYDGGLVRKIKLLLSKDDVNFKKSRDDMIHIYYNMEKMPNLIVEKHGDVLEIHRESTAGFGPRHTQDEAQAPQDWGTLSGFMNGIKRFLGNIYTNIENSAGGEITIAVPTFAAYTVEAHTTSGDVDIDEINLSELICETTSGNLTMVLVDDVQPGLIKAVTVSGDLDITASTPRLVAQAISGDVDYKGDCPDINVSTVSGDVDITGVVRTVNSKTVSGDVNMRVMGEELQAVNANTTSGDLEIHLPTALRGKVDVRMQTVSGSKSNRYNDSVETPLAYVNVNSVSGDVNLF